MVNIKSRSRKSIFWIIIIVLICLVGIGYYVWHHDKKQSVFVESTAHTTSKLATAQSNYTSGNQRSTSSSTSDQGGVTDNNGVVSSNNSTTDTGQSVSSSSGLITLDAPSANQTISSGVAIYGEAQVSTVQFQLIDNSTGLLAQGSLNVINGKFSGNIHFNPYSDSGVLNVFSQNSPTSPEVNLITILVGLK